MKEHKKQILITGVVIVTMALVGIGVFIIHEIQVKNKITLTFKEARVIEYGDKKITSKSFIKDNKTDSIEYPKLNVMKVGKQKLVYVAKRNSNVKKFTYQVEVKDTKKPVIKLKADTVTISLKETFKPSDNVESILDPIDGVIPYAENRQKGAYTIISDYDSTKAGKYKAEIKAEDKNGNCSKAHFEIVVEETKENAVTIPESESVNHKQSQPSEVQPTYVNGILLINKNHAVPRDFGGNNASASAALGQLQAGANANGYEMKLLSGYRSYDLQNSLYWSYVARDGQAAADRYSARPGTSEHQSGLAFDIGQLDDNFGNTPAGQWLAAHAHEYGFIIRYPQGKEGITGYMYEPWHVRYLGNPLANAVYNSGLTLEEYLGVY